MKQSDLKYSCLIAVLYFGMNVNAQTTLRDTVAKEQKIEEVVMIGYGSRKKSDLTTSVSSLKADDVSKTKVMNANQAIQGKVAGVNVVADDNPGSKPSVIIRGIGTALGGRAPLYVVDGVQIDGDTNANFINNINSNDIESYEVLKDASALAIFGNRAANGVIIITTKQGRGKMTVGYDTFVGVRDMLKTVKMAGSNLFANYSNLATGSIRFSQDQPVNTDWMKEITQKGFYTQHNVSLSGSTDKVNYNFALGYYDEQTILKGMEYKRFNFRTNNEFKVSKKIKITQTLGFSNNNNTPKPLSAFTDAYKQSPLIPVQWANGIYANSYVQDNGFAGTSGSLTQINNVPNPVAQLALNNEKQKTFDLFGGITAEYKILDDLKFTSQFGGEYNNYNQYSYADRITSWLMGHPNNSIGDNAYNTFFNTKDATSGKLTNPYNLVTKNASHFFNWNWSNYFTYTKKFGKHDLEVTLGTEASEIGSVYNSRIIYGNVPQLSNYWGANFATVNDFTQVPTGKDGGNVTTNMNRLNSYFGRFQYSYAGKYLLSGSIRRDGSSKFAYGEKWGTFPAFSAGWVISKENFMQNGFFDLLKIRGGWGKLGNQNVPLNYVPFDLYSYGIGGTANSGITVNTLVNSKLSWETTEETSLGLDFEILNRRLKGTVDIYSKRNKQAILDLKPILTTGISNPYYNYGASVSNKGIEGSLRWDDKIGDNLTYWIGGNIAYNKNNVESLSELANTLTGGSLGNGQITKKLSEGQPIGSFWLYEVAGYDNQGNFVYYDKNNNVVERSKLTDADRKFFGSVIAPTNYGVTAGIHYKNVDFSVDGYGQIGGKVFNGKKAVRNGNENIEYSIATNYWTPTNISSPNPSPTNVQPVASNYYLESSNFFRINNITLGYTLPKFSEMITSLRFYASAINPFIWQKYSGYSPEINGDGSPAYGTQGIELGVYPKLRSFVFGMNVKF
ncbi:SusC/RagA family TonB-linked outer membrane protein [Chryseobacterium taeanense]|uniref:SusC/RagA family TonB-linked outer membrane protein n=1 Tax=Chryseobacterium taeanense TaxID=311334 RepID=UPI0035B0AE84